MFYGALRVAALISVAMLLSTALPMISVAQSTYTNCSQTNSGFSCNSTTIPSVGDSILRGYEAGRRAKEASAARDVHEFDAERQSALEQQLEAQRRREALDRQPTVDQGLWPRATYQWSQPQDVSEDQALERAGQAAYWQQQVDACLRLEGSQGRPAEQCVDNLLITDSYFARANASLGGISQTHAYLAKARGALQTPDRAGTPPEPRSN